MQISQQARLYSSGDNGLTKRVRPFRYSHWLLRKSIVKFDNLIFFQRVSRARTTQKSFFNFTQQPELLWWISV